MTHSPISIPIDKAVFRCTVCKAPRGTCGCWTECVCGRIYRTGEKCRALVHIYEAVSSDVAATVLEKVADVRMSATARRAVEVAVYDAAYAWAKEFIEAFRSTPP